MGRGEEQLLEAVRLQDVTLVQKILSRGKTKLLGSSKKININYQNGEGHTALHQAALGGNTSLTFLLIDHNATIDIRDKKGLRPLHYSAWKGKVEVIAALLESGASCNASANNGCSPLHLAAQYGHCKACKLLLEYGADLSARQSDGCSPLDLACEFGREDVLRLLLHNNEAIYLPDQLQQHVHHPGSAPISSPLHLAARNGHSNIVRLLLQGGADINWRTESGTCLHEAVMNQKPEIVQLLIDCGIDVNQPNGRGQTAVELANKMSRSSLVDELLRKLTEPQPRFLQVSAVKDFQNVLDRNSLTFTKGTLITVLEQNPNGNWKGRIEGARGDSSPVGFFPASYVEIVRKQSHHADTRSDVRVQPHGNNVIPRIVSHKDRSSAPPKSPPHSYLNLDSRQKQSPKRAPLLAPNVNNPSYEDVICSQLDQPVPPRYQAVSSQYSIATNSSERSSESANIEGRPSLTNPGYEDVLVHHTAPLQAHNCNAKDKLKSDQIKNPQQSKMEAYSKADYRVAQWLASFRMEQYAPYFTENGYDLPTVARMSPSDLAAIRVSHPGHRKEIATRAAMLRNEPSLSFPVWDQPPVSIAAWLNALGLNEYLSAFSRAKITSIKQLLSTTWEDLQEMGIRKLGDQKKLLLSIFDLEQAFKRPSPHYYASKTPSQPPPLYSTPNQSAPPPSYPKPSAIAKKPPVMNKPPVSSFKESSGISSELQKALNKRQRVIDDADETKVDHPSTSVSSPREPVVSLRKGPRHSSSSRGPPPEPPKRISSVCSESSPVQVESRGDPREVAAGGERFFPESSVNNHTASTSHKTNPNNIDSHPLSVPHQYATKPSVNTKPKPVVMKKPNVKTKTPSPVKSPPVHSPNSTEKRFDLSALNNVTSSVHGSHNNDARGEECEEDFDWPAPPEFEVVTPEPVSTSSNLSVSQVSARTPHHYTDQTEVYAKPIKRDPHPIKSSKIVPSSVAQKVLSNNAEKDPLAPPMKFRDVPSLPEEVHSRPSPPVEFHRESFPLPPSTKKNSPLPPPTVEMNYSSPQRDTEVVPPPIPVKEFERALDPPSHNNSSSLDQLSSSDPAQTQLMLDDITSMFDGLAQEFDDILS